eukprot:Platyproteum_vivax@DN3838_c0_g1_i1.p1
MKTTKELCRVWAEAFDGYIRVPSRNTPNQFLSFYMHPLTLGQTSNCSCELPEILCDNVLYALSAFNPLAEERPFSDNEVANRKLYTDLVKLQHSKIFQVPPIVFCSFGFDLAGYREDGFNIAFQKHERRLGKETVVELAKKYEQGAIYEFEATNKYSMIRKTVPVLISDVDAAVTTQMCNLKSLLGTDSLPPHTTLEPACNYSDLPNINIPIDHS